MGNARFSSSAYASYADATTRSFNTTTGAYDIPKSVHETFVNRHIDPALDPRDISFRESCDSEANPLSTPIIVALDVTGSMGSIAYKFASESIGTLMGLIYEQLPVTDPHLMFMAIGDVARHDRAPLQVSQFEADIRIAEQLLKVYVEGGGGGNNTESYQLPWFFASRYTKTDSFAKRGKKGLLFTIGDECAPEPLTRAHIETVMGKREEFEEITSISAEELLADAQKEWEVFHVLVEQASYCSNLAGRERAVKSWRELLGKRLLRLNDVNNLEEVILAAIRVAGGMSPDEAIEKAPEKARGSIAHAFALEG